jgi:hypothetical protein
MDALSRHVGVVEQGLMPNKQEVLKEQLIDPFCERQKRNRSRTKASSF